MSEQHKRPILITFLGWLWAAIGLYAIVLPSILFVAWQTLFHSSIDPYNSLFLFLNLNTFRLFEWLAEHFKLFFYVSSFFGIITVYVSYNFLKMKEWSRTALAFLAMAALSCASFLLVIYLINLSPDYALLFSEYFRANSVFEPIYMDIILFFMFIVWCVCVWSVYCLVGKGVKDAFSKEILNNQ